MGGTGMPQKRFHYAWLVCIGCMLAYFLAGGFGCNHMSLYYPFLIERYSFSNTMISLLTTVRSLGNIGSLSLAPVCCRRFGMRKCLLAAMAVLVLGFLLLAAARSYPMFVLAYLIVGASYGMACMVPLSILLDRWFIRDKTVAISLVAASSGLATVGLPSLLTAIMKHSGVGTSALIEAAVVFVLGGIAVLLIRNAPEDKGISAYGVETGKEREGAAANEAAGTTPPLQENRVRVYSVFLKNGFLRNLPVYLVGICCGLICSAAYGNISMLAVSSGQTVETAALAVSVIGIVLTIGKFLFGWISDRFGVYRPSVIMGIFWILGMVLLCAGGLGKPVLFTGCVLYGLGVAMGMVCMVLWPLDWADGFEQDVMKQRLQVTYSATGIAFSVVPGITADLAGGSYLPIFVFYVLIGILLTALLIRNYRQARSSS